MYRREQGEERTVGGDTVLSRIDYPAEGGAQGLTVQGQVVDNQDGTYDVRYCPARACSRLPLRVSINGSSMHGSPFRPQIVSGPTAALQCTASGAGLNDGITGETSTMRIVARDAFGNRRRSGGDNFSVRVRGVEPANIEHMRYVTAYEQHCTAVDCGDGTYEASWGAAFPGVYRSAM